MKIKRPNKFRIGQSPERIEQYLAIQLQRTLDDITTVLQRLSFRDNFQSTIVNVVIPASTTDFAVRHDLKAIPSGKLIIKSNNSSIIDGNRGWDENYIYLSNPSATIAALTIVILE